MKQIKIACQGAMTLPIGHLHEFQGELKSLSVVNYEKLKTEIIDHGFSFTIHVWYSSLDKKWFILDGHQRIRTIKRLIQDGYECPELPCSKVEAEDYQQAKRKLLAATSQYGHMEDAGLLEYVQETNITPEELVSRYDFPHIDIIKFVESNYEGLSGAELEISEDDVPSDEPQYIVTVHCDNELQMQRLFEELKGRGLTCRLIT